MIRRRRRSGDEDDFREAFRPRFRRQMVVSGVVVAGILALVLVGKGSDSKERERSTAENAVLVVTLPAILGAVGFSLWNWRCPACSGYLGRGWAPRHCPHCAARLRD